VGMVLAKVSSPSVKHLLSVSDIEVKDVMENTNLS
jgi:hypothetical protein